MLSFKNLLCLTLFVMVTVCTGVCRAEETKLVETGWTPSAVGTFGAFYVNGDYKLMQSGIGVGTAYVFDAKNVSSVGFYIGPQSAQVDGKTDTSLFIMVYADLYQTSAGRFGLGLGTRAWQSGEGFKGIGRQDATFLALGYKFP